MSIVPKIIPVDFFKLSKGQMRSDGHPERNEQVHVLLIKQLPRLKSNLSDQDDDWVLGLVPCWSQVLGPMQGETGASESISPPLSSGWFMLVHLPTKSNYINFRCLKIQRYPKINQPLKKSICMCHLNGHCSMSLLMWHGTRPTLNRCCPFAAGTMDAIHWNKPLDEKHPRFFKNWEVPFELFKY